MNQYDDIELQIIKALTGLIDQELIEQKLKGDCAWTIAIKEIMGELGIAKGYDVCTSGFRDDYSSEWLFDLIWYRNDKDGFLIEVPLVMESEWDFKFTGIKYDFEKLLCSRSKYRVMIFQGSSINITIIRNKLQQSINVFRESRSEDRYLLAGWNCDSKRFNYSLHRPNKSFYSEE
jgi:hypothetical protein